MQRRESFNTAEMLKTYWRQREGFFADYLFEIIREP